MQPDELLGGDPYSVGVGTGPANIDPQIASLGPAELPHFLEERGDPGLAIRILLRVTRQHGDAARLVAGRLRQGGAGAYSRASERHQETASLHDHSLLWMAETAETKTSR